MKLSTIAAAAAVVASAAVAVAAQAPVETQRYRLTLPDEFAPLARLSAAPQDDAKIAVTQRAWGDLPSGCIAAVHDVAAKGADAAALHAALVTALGSDEVTLSETGEGSGAGADRRYDVSGAVEGLLRVVVGGKPASGVAALCFWSDREPALCRERCQTLIDSLEVTP